MHDIWNPWHGCLKYSEGCAHCYMYFLDKLRDADGSNIYKTKNAFDYPIQTNRDGSYKIKSGEKIRVCMTSDFFLEEADEWRSEAWRLMRMRPDVIFHLVTKRITRVSQCLPPNWGTGWDNIVLNATCENQRCAEERAPLLLELPFKHKGFMCAPFIGPVSLQKYLDPAQIDLVMCGGENYDGARPCHFEWVQRLRSECIAANISFNFIETGTIFVKDGKTYHLPSKKLQSEQAYKSGMNFVGHAVEYKLRDLLGFPIPKEMLYKPQYEKQCEMCASRMTCNGCAHCGQCQSDKQ